MMGPMQNAIRLQALLAMSDSIDTRVGLITSYEPSTFSVRVQMQPDSLITGWLPLCSPWIGNAWGMFCAPTVGDAVTVHFIGGDLEAGFVEGRFFNDVDRPLAVPASEFWLVHKSGQFFKLTNDGKATFSDGHGATITLNGGGSITSAATVWNHTGPVNVTGPITASTTITAPTVIGTTDVTFAGKSAIGHKHGGVSTGAGQTGVPV